jgi:hypothetical protein
MEIVDIAFMPAHAETFLELPSTAAGDPYLTQFVALHPSMVVHALSIVEVTSLLPKIYRLAWQFLHTFESQLQMAHQHNTRLSSSGKDLGINVLQNAPPKPEPEPEPEPPAAPPYVPFPLSGFKLFRRTQYRTRGPSLQYITSC